MRIFIDKNKCQGSGECIKVCPHGALRMENFKATVDCQRCDLDGLCIPACPHGAVFFGEDA